MKYADIYEPSAMIQRKMRVVLLEYEFIIQLTVIENKMRKNKMSMNDLLPLPLLYASQNNNKGKRILIMYPLPKAISTIAEIMTIQK